ncbi:hypothetical protein BK138_35580 [Paenibacillus rhizosphaerae]|uniref:Uncharacterized protein n=1 Tax=Paenibacillus rhizosphaerae TaxID=297318 RepID=A0A1R1DTP3_9BACL|nr:hypothetical protein BK138_35580 [Paenibacillus rhizosphaerae]
MIILKHRLIMLSPDRKIEAEWLNKKRPPIIKGGKDNDDMIPLRESEWQRWFAIFILVNVG